MVFAGGMAHAKKGQDSELILYPTLSERESK
jgi:hypothetical protein